MAKEKSITIRGVAYRTINAAAESLGVTRQAIQGAKQRGRLDFTGLHDHAVRPTKQTRLRGAVFNSRSEAAESIGVKCSELSIFMKVATLLQIDFK